jgi:hypothetical protein
MGWQVTELTGTAIGTIAIAKFSCLYFPRDHGAPPSAKNAGFIYRKKWFQSG